VDEAARIASSPHRAGKRPGDPYWDYAAQDRSRPDTGLARFSAIVRANIATFVTRRRLLSRGDAEFSSEVARPAHGRRRRQGTPFCSRLHSTTRHLFQ